LAALKPAGDDAFARLVAEADTGGRKPVGLTAIFLATVAIVWSLFQLWIASPLPFSLGVLVLNDSESRAIHLAFAVFPGQLAPEAGLRCGVRRCGAKGADQDQCDGKQVLNGLKQGGHIDSRQEAAGTFGASIDGRCNARDMAGAVACVGAYSDKRVLGIARSGDS